MTSNTAGGAPDGAAPSHANNPSDATNPTTGAAPTALGGPAKQRVCFQLQVKPERLAEYRERHTAVWPEMLRALKDTGWDNYSIFVREDGLLIGYFETASLDAARAGMAATEVNARWQAEMGEFFAELDGAPDEGFLQLTEIFNLEDQLAAADAAEPEGPRS